MDREQLRQAIYTHLGDVKACYKPELSRHPELAGNPVRLRFTSGRSGRVSVSLAHSETQDNSTVEQCMATAAKTWVFPPPPGEKTEAIYAFVLEPAK